METTEWINNEAHIRLESVDLHVLTGVDARKQCSFQLPLIRIGSAEDNEFVLADRAVSRYHAELKVTSKGIQLKDLNSTNGTFIRSVRVIDAWINEATVCKLGNTQISVEQLAKHHSANPEQISTPTGIVGESEKIKQLIAIIKAAASTNASVLVNGESGSGKEMVARALHKLSGRSGQLVVFDASVTNPEMIRNDLFGHVKGAFTGANGARKGAFREANNGTLFIDEIGELPLDMQPRLLRVLENREVTPVGSDKAERVDVRVVAATHRNLNEMVSEDLFRADLFHRLSVIPIHVPPLREIIDDIPVLVDHFMDSLGLKGVITNSALDMMQEYNWPGNMRELRNVLERACALSQNNQITAGDLHLNVNDQDKQQAKSKPTNNMQVTNHKELKDIERQMMIDALNNSNNNKTEAARSLNMSLSTFKRRLKSYNID